MCWSAVYSSIESIFLNLSLSLSLSLYIYIYSYIDRSITSWRFAPSLAAHCLKGSTQLSKTRANSSWFTFAISSRITHTSFCVMIGRFLYRHSFKHTDKKKTRTMRSDDPTGHGTTDTWKYSSSPIDRLHPPPIRCHWTGVEVAWPYLLYGAQTLPPNTNRRAIVWTVMCQSTLRHPIL